MNKYDYKNLTPFKWFVLENFPFIEADFDALTNWQLFCKLGKEMNKLIDTMNNVGQGMEDFSQELINSFNEFTTEINTTVEDYITRFNQLKDFVDNYFDNLDVQEEVNNKLDDMVESGYFNNLLMNFLNITRTYNTTIEMINDVENLTENQKIRTLGYSNINDFGGAFYQIINKNGITIDNYNFININSDVICAKLLKTNDNYNPMLYNDLNEFNKLQKTIDLCLNDIELNKIDKTIFLPKIFDLTGETLIFKKSPSNNNLDRNNLLRIYGGGFKKLDNNYLFEKEPTISSISNIKFENVYFKGSDDFVPKIMKSPSFINIFFENCNFTNWGQIATSETYIQSFSLINSTIKRASGNLFEFAGAYNLKINNCTIEFSKNSFVFKQIDTIATEFNKVFNINVINSLIEGFDSRYDNGFADLYRILDFNVENNYFEGLKNYIKLNSKHSFGILNIKNNRIFEQPTEKGFLNIITDTTNFDIPKINYVGNRIENIYPIFISNNTIKGYTFTNIISFYDNYFNNNFNNSYSVNSETKSIINYIPLIQLPDGNNSLYSRKPMIETNDSITYNKTIVQDEKTYNITYKIKNQIEITVRHTVESFSPSSDYIDLHTGIDYYTDDTISTSILTNYDCTIKNVFRQGTPNNKFARLFFKNNTQNAYNNITFIAKIICDGING